MALSADTVREYRNLGPIKEYPAVASDILYRGAALEATSGTADVVSGTGTFLGFSSAKVDNSAGSAGQLKVPVYTTGEVLLSVTGVTAASDYDSDVYATDDNTFTLTASGATTIGTIVEWTTGTNVWVKFQGSAERSI